jgi:hypothetical protein
VNIGPLKEKTQKRITAAEMKCVRRTAGYTWAVNKTNTDIAKELNVTPVLDKIQEYVYCATIRKVAGSISDGVIGFFH